HPPELTPRHFAAVDHEEREALVRVGVAADPPAHQKIGNPESEAVVLEMANRKRAAHACDQSRQERKEIALRVAEHLKLVAARLARVQLEGLEHHAITEQTHAKMELMPLAGRIPSRAARTARVGNRARRRTRS